MTCPLQAMIADMHPPKLPIVPQQKTSAVLPTTTPRTEHRNSRRRRRPLAMGCVPGPARTDLFILRNLTNRFSETDLEVMKECKTQCTL